MPPCAIVEDDSANSETTEEFHIKIEFDGVGEVETVFPRRHDVVGADGEHKKARQLLVTMSVYV